MIIDDISDFNFAECPRLQEILVHLDCSLHDIVQVIPEEELDDLPVDSVQKIFKEVETQYFTWGNITLATKGGLRIVVQQCASPMCIFTARDYARDVEQMIC